MAGRESVSGELAALGLVDDPDYQGNDQGYDQYPEEHREQHAEQTTAHHGAHATHHAASTKDRAEQQDNDRPDQSSYEYLQAVAHDLYTSFLLLRLQYIARRGSWHDPDRSST